MFFPIRTADKSTPYVVEFVADQDADVQDIPVDTIAPGSTVIVIANSTVYMLDTTKTWRLL